MLAGESASSPVADDDVFDEQVVGRGAEVGLDEWFLRHAADSSGDARARRRTTRTLRASRPLGPLRLFEGDGLTLTRVT